VDNQYVKVYNSAFSGTRRCTGHIYEFKKGAFHVAIKHGVPIVPVVFSSYLHFYDASKKRFDEGEIVITALPRIETKELRLNNVDELIEQTRIKMIEVFEKCLQKSCK
jgi:1-acyl-sn-glycerol-3-phosphate acyltransferase